MFVLFNGLLDAEVSVIVSEMDWIVTVCTNRNLFNELLCW